MKKIYQTTVHAGRITPKKPTVERAVEEAALRGLLVPGRCAEDATTVARSGPQPQTRLGKPAAYLTTSRPQGGRVVEGGQRHRKLGPINATAYVENPRRCDRADWRTRDVYERFTDRARRVLLFDGSHNGEASAT